MLRLVEYRISRGRGTAEIITAVANYDAAIEMYGAVMPYVGRASLYSRVRCTVLPDIDMRHFMV